MSYMARRVIVVVSGLTLLLLGGCGATFRVNMPNPAPAKISSTEIMMTVQQNEIYAEVERSNLTGAMGGGLLFALIDSSIESGRTEKAEEAIKPVRNALLEYNFNDEFIKATGEQLKKIDWLKISKINLIQLKPDQEIESVISKSASNMVLKIDAKYYLSPKFDQLVLEANVTAFPNDKDMKAIAEKYNADTDSTVLYRENFKKYERSVTVSKSLSETAGNWTVNNGATIKSAMQSAVQELAKQIASGLEADRNRKVTAQADTASVQ